VNTKDGRQAGGASGSGIEAPRWGQARDGATGVAVARQVAELVEAELPLAAGLRAIAEEMEDQSWRADLMRLASALESGSSLDDAIEAHGARFPAFFRGLLEAGIPSGRLFSILNGAMEGGALGTEIRRQVWLRLFYPLLLLGSFVGLALMLGSVLAGNFKSIFVDFGIPLSSVTLVGFMVSDALGRIGIWLVLGPVVGAVVAWVLLRLLFSAEERGAMLLKVPLLGSVYRFASLADFCRMFGLLLGAELPMPRALELAGQSVHDPLLHESCRVAAEHVRNGQPLAEALRGRAPFQEGFGRFVEWTETTRTPAEALTLAGEIYAERARSQGRFVATFAAVVLVAMVLWGAVMLVLMLLLPMLALLNALFV
jgi:type II secretory pathway component PulF